MSRCSQVDNAVQRAEQLQQQLVVANEASKEVRQLVAAVAKAKDNLQRMVKIESELNAASEEARRQVLRRG